jgi:hypothetical protein
MEIAHKLEKMIKLTQIHNVFSLHLQRQRHDDF